MEEGGWGNKIPGSSLSAQRAGELRPEQVHPEAPSPATYVTLSKPLTVSVPERDGMKRLLRGVAVGLKTANVKTQSRGLVHKGPVSEGSRWNWEPHDGRELCSAPEAPLLYLIPAPYYGGCSVVLTERLEA